MKYTETQIDPELMKSQEIRKAEILEVGGSARQGIFKDVLISEGSKIGEPTVQRKIMYVIPGVYEAVLAARAVTEKDLSPAKRAVYLASLVTEIFCLVLAYEGYYKSAQASKVASEVLTNGVILQNALKYLIPKLSPKLANYLGASISWVLLEQKHLAHLEQTAEQFFGSENLQQLSEHE